MANGAVTITVDGRAAAVNDLARDIGDWADRKGFREDWDDANFLDGFADNFTSIDWDATDVGSVRANVERLHKIADSHRRLANICKLMLMVSELGEALEGMRDGGNYDEELADVVIRVLENANKNGIALGDKIVEKMNINEGRAYKHGRNF